MEFSQTYGPKNRAKESVNGENHVEAGSTTKQFANYLEKSQDAQQEALVAGFILQFWPLK